MKTDNKHVEFRKLNVTLSHNSMAVFISMFATLLFLSTENLAAQSVKNITWYVGGGYNSVISEDVAYDSGLFGNAMLGIKVPEQLRWPLRWPLLGLILYEYGPTIYYNYFSSSDNSDDLQTIHIFWSGKYGRFQRDDTDLKNKEWPVIIYAGLGASF